jgi:hypothetical protein
MDRELLERKFEPHQIKQRKGPGGTTLDYIDTPSVINRLNEAFDGDWSYEIESFEQKDGQVVVLGKLTASGITKMQFGSKAVMVGKNGNTISIGDDLKAAASDALKKCATLLGVALHLYEDEAAPSDSKGSSMTKMTQNKGNGRITKQQLGQIKSLRTKLGWSGDQAIGLVQQLYNTDNPLALNSEQAKNVIAVLAKKLKEQNEASEPAEQEEII